MKPDDLRLSCHRRLQDLYFLCDNQDYEPWRQKRSSVREESRTGETPPDSDQAVPGWPRRADGASRGGTWLISYTTRWVSRWRSFYLVHRAAEGWPGPQPW